MSSQAGKPRGGTANIFINYRREDSSGHTGRLFDALSSQFSGRLFMDIDTLEPGVDFVDAIEQAVGTCEVLIVVIGREWLSIKNAAGRRRLDDPADYVRLELESALERKIRVIPVLVQDAPMPSTDDLPPSLARLARRNAIELSDARWAYDVDRLARTIQDILKEKEATEPAAGPAPQTATRAPGPVALAVPAKAAGSRAWLFALAALVLVAVVVMASVLWMRRTPSGKEEPTQGQRANLESVATAPTPQAATGSSASGEPTPNPAAAVTPKSSSSGGKAAPATDRAIAEPPPKELTKASPPTKANRVAPPPVVVPVDLEPTDALKRPEVHPPTASIAALHPPRATITAPKSDEKMGSTVQVQGTVPEYDSEHYRIFLCIRQGNGSIYPRGELFPKDGQWSIQLRSSKEKTFEILVVATSNKESAQVLSDQRSRDDGIPILPAGASISSEAVAVKRQGKFEAILNPKRPGN